MDAVITCLSRQHDPRLLISAAAICVIGVYAAFALAQHARRSDGRARRNWALASMLAAGCTAWATHMIALLAYEPGMPAAFDLGLTALSLLMAIVGIGLGMALMLSTRRRRIRFASGILLGGSVAVLHYLGQFSYAVTGAISWDAPLALGSLTVSLVMDGAAMLAAGERNRMLRRAAPPLLLLAIAVVHVGGMTSMTLAYDPRIDLPALSAPPETIAPIVAGVSLALIALACFGLHLTRQAQARLRRDRARLSALSNLSVEGLVVCEGDVITLVNDSFARLAGVPKEEVEGGSIGSIIPTVALSGMEEREEWDAELASPSGKLVPVRVLRSDVVMGRKKQTVFAFRDQRERLKSEEVMRRLAYTDSLTGLTNRMRFTDILNARAAQAASSSARLSLLAIDLDRFKWVNDTFGHSFGDGLLRQVADRLRRCAGRDDLVGRLGGDEFTILCMGGADRAAALAERIVGAMGEPFLIEGQSVDIGASVGIAHYDLHGADADALARSADLALYQAKHSGKGRCCVFEPQMLEDAMRRSELERDLRLALKRDELEVHYQPQTSARGGAVEGAEALARWRHPERGMISPTVFIPLAEEIGLMGAIGERVLRIACGEAAKWPAEISLAVNLSPVQLGDQNLVDGVARVLAETGFPPARLELEVTESALLRDDARTYANLHGLRALGIRISLDDFGTGYSSLSHLRRFPFNKVKIDQSFVRQIPSDPDSVAIVQAIVTMATKLRMSVTIEGVETPEQEAFALTEGCDQIQGFLISRPVPASDMSAYIARVRDDGAWIRNRVSA